MNNKTGGTSMSFDLYFFKRRNVVLADNAIEEYLRKVIGDPENQSKSWLYFNEDTGVYFVIDNDSDDCEYNRVGEYVNVRCSFHLNYMRPSFFGLEGFQFLEQFCKDLNLVVLDPQSDSEIPYLPTATKLFAFWNVCNLSMSNTTDHADNFAIVPESEATRIWYWNYGRKELQDQLGDFYFVPKIFFMQQKSNGMVVSVVTWTDCIPTVLPSADYYLLMNHTRKWFRTKLEQRLVSRDKLMKEMRAFISPFTSANTFIIKPEAATHAPERFLSIKADENYSTFLQPIQTDRLLNH